MDLHPDRDAFTFLADGETATAVTCYRGARERAHRVAALLQHSGVAPGDRVLLLYAPSLEFFWALLGCFYAGAIAVPTSPPISGSPEAARERLRRILVDSDAAWLASDTALHGLAGPLLAGVAPRWIVTDAEAPPAGDARAVRVRPDDVALLQYTSGSTGTPRGVVVTHASLAANQAMIHDGFGTREGFVVMSWLPVYHDMGLGTCLHALFVGGSVVLMSPLDFVRRPVRWLEAMARHRGQLSGGPNFSYELCVRKVTDEALAALDLSSWEVAYCGAEPIHAETLRRFADRFARAGLRRSAVLPCYGMAEIALYASGTRHEAGPVIRSFDAAALEQGRVCAALPGADGAHELVGCGPPVAGEDIAIVEPASLTRAAPDRVGEIWIRGDHVCAGYYRNADATAQTFGARLAPDERPWLRTGDLGFFDQGELYITGRRKDLVIVDGRNLYPHDLERAIERAHPAVRPGCVAVFGVPRDGSEQPAAVIEVDRAVDASSAATLGEIVRAARQAIASEFAVTVHDVVLVRPGTIPKTSSGKLQRAATRALVLGGRLERLGARA